LQPRKEQPPIQFESLEIYEEGKTNWAIALSFATKERLKSRSHPKDKDEVTVKIETKIYESEETYDRSLC